jgi:hypothetical protein
MGRLSLSLCVAARAAAEAARVAVEAAVELRRSGIPAAESKKMARDATRMP